MISARPIQSTTARTGDPGRYLIDINGMVPVLPKEQAGRQPAENGYVIEGAARKNTRTDEGWSQIGVEWWTAPCQPTRR
ncbi:hypothetical protein IF655_05745 [Streptomyces sp. DSM 110735]|uniref:hypothetical protein n=1 Tax=Streptomyces sp. DSM 110735 TaxID=2775031 RepID=UPI0018F748A7|nr:hypothetical protein [Streptomyces sp. DSM 110735]MBJ7902798.1 hypothetical protein [Streptomyces sp. DSM 110735]